MMKRFTSLAIFIAIALSMSAQYYMHLWTDGITYSLPILNVDSVTFTDGPLSTPEIPDIPNDNLPEDGIIFDADIDLGNASLDSSNPSAYTVSKSGVTIDVAMGVIGTSGGEKHYRIYRGQTLVVTSTVGNITSVSFNCIVEGNEKYGPGCFSANTGSYAYSGAVGVWNGDADKVVFTAATNQVRATEIIVSIADNENEEPTTPEEPEVPIPNPEIADGVGVFSVGEGKTVTFSPGNLQYHPANDEWRFAEHQWNYVGEANSSIAADYDGWLDLFGWGTGDCPTKASEDYTDYPTFVDWGTNKIGNDAPNTWRTLTMEEFAYIRYTRDNAAELIGIAQVNGVNGVILLPDNWSLPDGIVFKAGGHTEESSEAYALYQAFDSEQWSKMEALGAVFIPASGWRKGKNVGGVESCGCWWHSTSVIGNQGVLCTGGISIYSTGIVELCSTRAEAAYSVRLVKDLEDETTEPEQPGEGGEEPGEPEIPIPNPDIVNGVGVFSVSASRTVTFSPGNLQYHPKNDVWRFAEHQSISLDSANLNIAPDYDGWLDLFGWSGSTGPAYGVSSSDVDIYDGAFVDWGSNQIGEHAPNTWRTLSIYEWEYLLFNRENAASLHFGAIVNGKHGRVLLPDNWEEVKPLDFEAQYEYNIIQWNEIEALGAVFLPAGGDRVGDFQLMNYQNWGSYWTSTTESYDCNWAYDVSVSSYSIILNYSTHILRFVGESVRLVKDIVNPDISENGHEYVDLGLSVKWATCNIGANRPEEYGDYFAWGEVEPKEVYDWNTYKWCNGSYDNLTKYNNNSTSGITDNLTVLNVNDDAAIVNWGGKWRMPTDAEFTELYEQCTWTWITENGTNGYKVIGPNGNSIFLPASGGIGVDNLNGEDSQAYYWSSSICSEFQSNAYSLCFSSNSVENHNNLFRCLGHSIRPVCGDVIIESDPNEDRPEVSCDDVLASGNCGDNVTWKVCSNRILYIEGEGKITSSPWRDANYDIDDIYIEEGITSICADAFRYMSFSSISLPLSLEYIGDLAFFNNNGHCKTIYIPKNVNYIGKGIVSASWYLEEIVVSPNNQHYKSIDGVCYDKQLSKAIICPVNIQLEELDLPNTIVEIADWAFYSVQGKLESITASEGLLSIGEQAFNDCHVDTINLPSSLTSMVIDMAGGPFTSTEIKAIHVVPGGQYYRSEDGVLYTADYSTLVAYPGGRIEPLYTVHPNTKIIESWALSNNIGVEEVILPQGVEEIGYYAMGASTYKKVIIPATVTDISWWAFSMNISNLTPGNFREGIWFESSTPCTVGSVGVFNSEQKIYVPCDAVDAYKNKWSRIEKGVYIENIYPYPSCSDNSSEGIGAFSVSADKQVTFSPGNLQYHPANDEWRFAEHQWDYIGDANDNISSTYNGWLDLFAWGTGNNPTYVGIYNYYRSFVDWGTNQIGSDAPNTWRTLTRNEWEYLLETRPNASSLKGIAQVNGVNGLIFLPDNWTCPSGVTFKSGFHSSNGVDYYADYQTFTADQWLKLEMAGAIFLPAAGERFNLSSYSAKSYGTYWSATMYDTYYAYFLKFYSDEAYMIHTSHFLGRSVRLVKDL